MPGRPPLKHDELTTGQHFMGWMGTGKSRLSLVCLSLLAGMISAHAQDDRRNGEIKGGPPGAFDFYVLALSWSPGFCELEGDGKAREQCAPGKGLGFVVHGLWPQSQRGYPTECSGIARAPSRLSVDMIKDLYPDEGLARFEWRRHGTCSGKSPTDYFTDVRKARSAVIIPPPFRQPKMDQTWTPIDLERAFVAANRNLRPDMMAVTCRRGVLQEVRICFSKDLRQFQPCPDVDRRGCRGGELHVNAVR
jgi:ribonuclease T2